MQHPIRPVPVGSFFVGPGQPLTIISGPCVIDSEEETLFCARTLKEILGKFPVNFIFKASYDKANRAAYDSFRGPGLEKGLEILARVKKEYNIPVLTDVHWPQEAAPVSEVCDVLQIPAFLCRQTDLVTACAKTGKPIHVKKGQFVAPGDVGNIIDKIRAQGNENIILADRGVSFGYNYLISDMRAIPIMQSFGVPVTYDANHSVQRPGGDGKTSGGERQFIPYLARAAVAAGANAIFLETHPEPARSKSDSSNIYPLGEFESLIRVLVELYEVVRRVV
jgi:2-dehydro-3-deoxyphosphooctonate aldolase (KDO 8-P synthase)